MAVPSLALYSNGINVVSGDNLNTFVQTCNNAATLRGLTGTANMTVNLTGISAANDGYGGMFYWNSASTAADDNYNVIVPNGLTTGAWNRVSSSVTSSNFVSSNGFLATGAFGSTYTDGIVVDYTAGTGRISVGTADGITLYTGGVGGTPILAINSSGTITTGLWGGTALAYTVLPPEVQNVPVGVIYEGKPTASQRRNIPINQTMTLSSTIGDQATNWITVATSPASFILSSHAATGTLTTIGTLTVSTSNTLSGTITSGLTFAAGSSVVIDAPGTQDATMADGGLTLMFKKV